MNVQKAHWHLDGDNVRVTMPLQKVDVENRIVSGFATLDNVDQSRDVVLSSASKAAFENFRGNIRLMHQPIPAGKLVNFREEEYYDSKTQKFYSGIFVDVYVSKGAPDIWEMCLDGTLTGFSIGGQVTDAESQYVKDAGGAVRFIKAYDLIELSLVDSPMNQLCDVVSITKSSDGSTSISGMASEVVAENVFYCAKDEVAFTSQDAEKACTACGGNTDNIGWFESDGTDKTEKVNALVADFTKTDSVEGRVNKMADDVSVSEVVETEVQEEPTALVVNGDGPDTASGEALGDDTEAEHAAAVEDAEEAAEEIEAAEDDEEEFGKAAQADDDSDKDGDDDTDAEGDNDDDAKDDVKKLFAELSAAIEKVAADSADATEAQITKVLDRLSAVEAVVGKVDELVAKAAELEKNYNAVSDKVNGVESTVEKSVGVKKSGDLGGSQEGNVAKAAKPLWNGRFFGSVENI